MSDVRCWLLLSLLSLMAITPWGGATPRREAGLGVPLARSTPPGDAADGDGRAEGPHGNLTARCGSDIALPGIRLIGYNPQPLVQPIPPLYGPVPIYTSVLSLCALFCSPYLGYARIRSNGDCYCVGVPLGGGGTTVADVNSDFDSGVYPNVSPPLDSCASFKIAGLKFMFEDPAVEGPTTQSSDDACSNHCWTTLYPPGFSRNAWTRALDSGQCWCSISTSTASWRNPAIVINSNWNSGINYR